jgi:PAS domain S-box-containing protein
MGIVGLHCVAKPSGNQGGKVVSASYLTFVERFSRITPFIVAAVGATALLGWIVDVEVLKSVLPGLATMKANTACAFIAAGGALGFLAVDSPVFRRIAHGLLVMVIAVGGLTLVEYIFAIDVGIDQFLLSDAARSAGNLRPGRMSLATALNFCLIGIALLALPPRGSRRSGSWAPWIALPVALVSMVAVVGYAYDARALYTLGPYNSMAIHTAMLFIILCLAVICANPTRGIVGIVISDTAGGIVSRRLLPTIPLALFALGWLRLAGQNAGYYGTHAGLAIMVAASITVSTLAIALTVSTLHEMDLRRGRAEAALVAVNADLEARVLARTADLARSLEVEVAERRRAEASENRLAVSEDYLDFALRSHQLGAWSLDLKTHAAHRTLIHDQIFGYPTLLPIWTFEMFLEHVIAEDRAAVDRSFQAAVAAHSDWAFTCRIRRADGEIRHILAAGTHSKDAAGTSVRIQGLVQDISERKGVEEVQQQLSALVEFADDAIVTKSLDGVVRSWNPAAQRLLGYRADEIIGQSVNRLLPEDRLHEESMILDLLARGEHVSHFETVRRRRNGTLVDVSLTISPIRDRAGIVVGASKIMRDISARKHAENELRRSNEDLGQKNKDLDDFVYTASHDLRSPLAGVSAVAQWILDDDSALTEVSRARLALIQGRIERMKRLLNDIRDYARAGQSVEPSGAPLSAAALVAEVSATLHVPTGFSIRCDPSLEAVQITRVPLEQVLHNLIGNAIKHHDRGTGIVTVAVELSGSCLRFSVIDDGPGIPDEYRSDIFEMFKTLKPRDEVEGSGMGLALVKKIVGKMGGNFGIEAAGGRGASFWFDWPRSGQPLEGAT